MKRVIAVDKFHYDEYSGKENEYIETCIVDEEEYEHWNARSSNLKSTYLPCSEASGSTYILCGVVNDMLYVNNNFIDKVNELEEKIGVESK